MQSISDVGANLNLLKIIDTFVGLHFEPHNFPAHLTAKMKVFVEGGDGETDARDLLWIATQGREDRKRMHEWAQLYKENFRIKTKYIKPECTCRAMEHEPCKWVGVNAENGPPWEPTNWMLVLRKNNKTNAWPAHKHLGSFRKRYPVHVKRVQNVP